jgi:hypothetical protein
VTIQIVEERLTVTKAFPFTLFIIYGCHWCNVAYTNDPLHNLAAAFGTNGADSKPYNSGQGMYNLTM